ncbi:hypothetical protein Pmar_PMAR023140 [Perkinsus marinus ATCC 50983]|uniref:Uncharacterized protein n=1 Tax=Perkinsus marinus (strain ATCC 50983 / TXsc) TaxID=423536 RepID=C5L1S5_PERM5|nr:hypothetical protein Pmar_PMAR023140 [Perkinsus marinus ATCC 50983]EER09318.1 hypothetical protein Pmar_PMAR023140 [Perkinsus marinus ATCC 50983]|eukprot:XP_002777502.1 hypothetical protein Pmar_PMAR023140 [Perkinsus marinus ATCC 50983]
MNGVNVRVPANPEAALKSHFGPTSLRLINMKEIPRNYKYGSYRLVVGQTLHDEIAHKHSPDSDAQHAKPLENSSLTKEDISSKVFAETTAADSVIIVSPTSISKGALASPPYNSTVTLREVETTSLLESHQPLKEFSNPFISVSFVACMSFLGIALLYFFVFKRFRSTSIPSSTSTPSSSYRQVHSPPNSV